MIHVANNLYRGSRPKSFADLKGIDTVINLQSGAYEVLTDSKYEHENAEDFGMIEVNIECSDVCPPTRDQANKFLEIVAKAKELGKNVYVHCLRGKDRTGFMCAVYRMLVFGWTFDQAVEEMFNLGFHKTPYNLWLPALEKMEK